MRSPSALKLMANDGTEAALAFALVHFSPQTHSGLSYSPHVSVFTPRTSFSSPLALRFIFSFFSAVILCHGQLVVISEEQKGVSATVNCKRRHDTSSLLLYISLHSISLPLVLFASLGFFLSPSHFLQAWESIQEIVQTVRVVLEHNLPCALHQ